MKRTYYVAFQSGLTWKFWDVFTDKDYRHCFLFLDREYGHGSIWYEYRRGWMVIEDYILTAADIIEVLKTCPEQSTVLKITLDPWERKRYPACGLITCVSIIKAVLGITDIWILTPRQLLNHLRSLGAETVLETHHGEIEGTGQGADRITESTSPTIEGQGAGSKTGENGSRSGHSEFPQRP